MAIIPINADIKITDYWQFRADSIEWLYVLHKLEKSVTTAATELHCLIATNQTDGSEIYLLAKKHYPTKVISAATGLSLDKLDEYEGVITLKSKEDKNLPEATVQGWGEA